MDTTKLETEANGSGRPATDRTARHGWEAEAIAAARAAANAGDLIDEAEIDSWIDSLGTDHECEPPRLER